MFRYIYHLKISFGIGSKSRKVNHEAKVLAPKSRVQGVKRERVLSITRGLVGDSQVVFQNTNARWSFLETVYRMLLYGLTMTEHVFLWGSSTEKGIGWRPWANIFEVDKSWFVTLHSTE